MTTALPLVNAVTSVHKRFGKDMGKMMKDMKDRGGKGDMLDQMVTNLALAGQIYFRWFDSDGSGAPF